ncbi:MAG: outer membrane beta-barrel family protein [Muribaculaceae bacterium]|nr:outer membrane beta-barrel family protein [Muribaculaceae bacterium]
MMSLKNLMAGLLLCLISSTPIEATVMCTANDSTIIESSVTDSIEQLFHTLGEITVTGSRPAAKLKKDGIQVAISGTYLANTGTALDVLTKMPFVTQSDSRIEVLGKGTPIIYLNGRQVRDLSELNQLASSQIKNIEVVTNPGARYAATVNSVIRITTIAPVGEGFSLSDRTTVGYKHFVYLFEQVNLNWRRNGFDLFGMLNYENYRERPGFSNNTLQYLKSGVVQQNSDGENLAKYPIYQGKIGLNYSNSSHNFGFFYDFSFKPSTSTGHSSTDRYIDNIFSETLVSKSDANIHNRHHLFNTYYFGNIGKWNLSANFDLLRQINDRHNAEKEISSVNGERVFSTTNDVDNRLIAGNLIASLPVWKGNLRFGTEISNIHRTDKYFGNTEFINDNDIKISETTSALFAETDQSFGSVSVTAGLRWEYTDSKYWQFGKLNDDESRKYHNLAPSASLTFPIGNVRANLSYMHKITRPAFEQLSSAVKYLDRYSYESGNPNLRPIYRDYLSADVAWKDIVIELQYLSTKNYFMWQAAEYADHPDITLLTMVNMPRFSSFGAFINYSPTFFSCWHPAFMAGIEAQNFKIKHIDRIIKLDKPLGIFRFNNAIHLPWNIWLNVDFSSRTSGDGDNFHLKSYWQCNLGVYKSFANDTWSIKLQLNDVFDTWRQEATYYNAISQVSFKKLYDTRDLSLTIRYNFNSSRSRYKGRGVANTEKDRF